MARWRRCSSRCASAARCPAGAGGRAASTRWIPTPWLQVGHGEARGSCFISHHHTKPNKVNSDAVCGGLQSAVRTTAARTETRSSGRSPSSTARWFAPVMEEGASNVKAKPKVSDTMINVELQKCLLCWYRRPSHRFTYLIDFVLVS